MEAPHKIAVMPQLPKRITETTEAETADDVLIEYEYLVINPEWERTGDQPEVQVVAIYLSYNAHGCETQEVSTRFLPGKVLQKVEEEIAERLVREAA